MKNYFRFVVFALLGLMSTKWASAQNVTVRPETGNLIGALSYSSGGSGGGTEVGLTYGFSALWRHKQLPLSFMTADDNVLTDAKILSNHANNMIVDSDGKLTICASGNGYFVLALPKGYRFTGYKMVLKDKWTSKQNSLWNSVRIGTGNWSFGEETENWQAVGDQSFTFYRNSEQNATNGEYTIERVSDNMSNILYFHLTGGGNSSTTYTYVAALQIQSFEVTFEVDAEFETTLAPTSASSTGVSVVYAPFKTGRVDLGPMKYQVPHQGTTSVLCYTYTNVKDLSANNVIYEADAITNGAVDATKGQKNITQVRRSADNQYYYGMKPDTYYVETPTSATAQGNNEVPVGYRIIGVKIKYGLKGSSDSNSSAKVFTPEKR